jgi:hypothetical protein
VNLQVHQWLEEVANQRRHRETNQTPQERFQPEALRAVPAITPDYRDVAEALVHKDLRLSFDGNRYCVPPRYIGRQLTIKADSSSVTLDDQHQEIVSYSRCWQRGQNLGGERRDGRHGTPPIWVAAFARVGDRHRRRPRSYAALSAFWLKEKTFACE